MQTQNRGIFREGPPNHYLPSKIAVIERPSKIYARLTGTWDDKRRLSSPTPSLAPFKQRAREIPFPPSSLTLPRFGLVVEENLMEIQVPRIPNHALGTTKFCGVPVA